jgi:uroporphyrin-III C-methyltransferase
MDTKSSHLPLEQEKINKLLLEYAQKRDVVVRLKGGDSFVFGRGRKEMLFLAEHGIEVEAIPGVSSATEVPTSAGITLTFRGISSSFAVITGHEDPRKEKSSVNWECLKGIDRLVFLMGVSRRQLIAQRLLEVGRDPKEPVALIEKGTTLEERSAVCTLEGFAKEPPDVKPSAVMVVGNVVELRKDIKDKALASSTI